MSGHTCSITTRDIHHNIRPHQFVAGSSPAGSITGSRFYTEVSHSVKRTIPTMLQQANMAYLLGVTVIYRPCLLSTFCAFRIEFKLQ